MEVPIIKKQLLAVTPYAVGDPLQVQNVLMNIALNSRDAMPNGGELNIESSDAVLGEEDLDKFPFNTAIGTFVRVHGKKNMGTTMDLYFPLKRNAVQMAREPAVNPVGTRGSEKIMLVDDEDLVPDDMDGYEFFKEMKRMNPLVRVLATSGYGINDRIKKK